MYTEVELYDMNHGGGIDARMEEEMLEMRARGESEVNILCSWGRGTIQPCSCKKKINLKLQKITV